MAKAKDSTTGPSESMYSSFFSNPFGGKKKKPDVNLPLRGPKDRRLIKGTDEETEYLAKKKSGGPLARKIFESRK